ncbi:MAG: glycosyltransferase [Pseudoflavonifractor sp.]|nr:glycosyltransferase [Alloprevotella sp.]MCM1117131.1 glycosyltransferase [Pseudoflavonifractor sp.]
MNNTDLWSFDLPGFVWLLIGLALVASALIYLILFRRLKAIVRASSASGVCPVLDAADYPGVTIVVYARDNAANLPILIRQIYAQDYPGPLEVVVVADLSGYDTADVDAAGALQPEFPSLRVTYIPAHSRNLSRKKLAVTLGVKASKMPFVALTCGNCSIPSADWLRRMMTHAAEGKKVVVGASTMRDSDGNPGPRRRLRGFDDLWQASRSIGSALKGHPHRATGHNLIYSRDLFFANGGFATSLNLSYGDDDLFVNEIANGVNTAVELAPSSIVEVLEPSPVRAHRMERLRRDFTAGYLPQNPRLAMGLASCSWWAWLASSLAAAILGWPSLIPLIAVVVIALALCIPMMIWWRRAARALRCCDSAFLLVPLLMLWHPIYDFRYRLAGLRHRRDNYTWSKIK